MPASPSRFTRFGGWPAVALLVAIAAVLRFGNMWFTSASPVFWVPTSDEAEHWEFALQAASGAWFGPETGIHHRPQLFAYFVALIIALFGPSFLALHLVIATIDSLAVGLWYLVARAAFPKPAAFLGALLIACYGPIVHFAGTGYMESFVMALAAGMLLALARFCRRDWTPQAPSRRVGWLVLAGVLGGAIVLARPNLLIAMPAIAVVLLAIGWRSGGLRRLLPPLVFGLCFLAAASPLAIRHWVYFGIWAPLGVNAEISLHMGNNRDGWGWHVSSPGIEYQVYILLPTIEGGILPGPDPAATRQAIRAFWLGRVGDLVREEPLRFLAGIGHKALLMLNAREVYMTQNFQLLAAHSPIERVLPGFGLGGVLGLVGLCHLAVLLAYRLRGAAPAGTPNRWLYARVFLALWIVANLAGVVLYIASARHRIPVLPPLLLLGGGVLWLFISALAQRNKRRVGALVLAGLFWFVVSRLPILPDWIDAHERWWSQMNVATAERLRGRPTEAIAAIERAEEHLPGKLETSRQLVFARADAGDREGAVAAQRELVARIQRQYPRFTPIIARELEGGALLASEYGLHEDAIAFANELVGFTDRAPRALDVLARVQARAGS